MKTYVLFGCGDFGHQALHFLGAEHVAYFLDNNPERQGTQVAGKEVFSLSEKLSDLSDKQVVISITERYVPEVEAQLQAAGVSDFVSWWTIYAQLMKERAKGSRDNLAIYQKAIQWLEAQTLPTGGVANTSELQLGYPEVSGYFIPTLLRWGDRERALSYAKWLISIQHENGAWYDTQGKKAYVFDTGQVLKGLVAILPLLPEAEPAIRKGCDWLLSQMDEDGRLLPADSQEFVGLEHRCAERIHLYCLSPIRDAGRIFDEPRYEAAVQKCLDWYKSHQLEEILNFDLLSHFHAYVMEALVDLGELDLAREGMRRLEQYRTESGIIPAYHDVHWVCSTGLFQLALVWFRLGDIEKGNEAFEAVMHLQNPSGGWYGSYPDPVHPEEHNTYFPMTEISWAVKYFLDALAAKNKAEFENMSDMFLETIRRDDGLYKTVHDVVAAKVNEHTGEGIRVLDIGCGKGRYLKNLVEDVPEAKYYAVDLSRPVMEKFDLPQVVKRQGALTQIPFEDGFFDVVYACESLEHAVDISSAVRELCRVVRPGGKIVILDKNDDHVGEVMIEPWEQWFSEEGLKSLFARDCASVEVRHGVPYTMGKGGIPDLFSAWIGTR